VTARDRFWIALLACAFIFGLAVSWERWGSPVIDSGREMNQPLRLAQGERLYSDVRHIYGPLSPWLHAILYRAFGASLSILYLDGAITAIVILALVYWLSRRIMDSEAAGAATLSVMWLCVFKPAGNFIFPYSFNALHATALGLATLAAIAAALTRAGTPARLWKYFALAGILAGLTMLAKTEMGFAALAAGVAGAFVATRPDSRRGAGLAAAFIACAAGLAIAVYGVVAARVGWSTLVSDSFLLLYNVPPALAYYNSRISGFDRPLESIGRMLIAAVKLGILAAIVGGAASVIGGARRGWDVLAGAVALLIVLSLTTGLDWDRGPYLAIPFLLLGLLIAQRRLRRTPVVIVYAVYALASLGRMILHVRSGGAYGSFLLPMSVVLFTYAWIGPFAGAFREPRARRAARAIPLALMIAASVGTAIVLAYRYRVSNTVTIATSRGTMIAPPDVGQAWNEALDYIERRTRPGDAVAVLPEGTSLDFLSGRRNPLAEEIATPGFLDGDREARAIRQLDEAATPLILIANRLTAEFGAPIFGRDYSQSLMRWIEDRYTPCAMFGPVKTAALRIGDKPFFLRAYCRRP